VFGLGLLAGTIRAESVESAHLLDASSGWAVLSGALFRTTDAGRHWKDITPHVSSPEGIVAIFFLNASTGWALLVHSEEVEGVDIGADARFELASTTDGGTSWTLAPLDVPHRIPGRGLSELAWMFFVDPLHGWIMVRENGNTNTSLGHLLATRDGGKSWHVTSGGAPVAGPLRFATATNGWLTDYSDGFSEGFYATSDGGENWRQVTVTPPPQAPPNASIAYQLPLSTDSTHVYVQVIFSDEQKTILALYASGDGGLTWTLSRAVPREQDVQEMITMAGSFWIVAGMSKRVLTVTTITSESSSAPSASVSTDISGIVAGLSSVEGVSFADRNHGWVLAGNRLLSTTDGGVNWSDISPIQVRKLAP
jgi:photosystem II stability/assembly factor-like uncharacterized protein